MRVLFAIVGMILAGLGLLGTFVAAAAAQQTVFAIVALIGVVILVGEALVHRSQANAKQVAALHEELISIRRALERS